MSRGAILVTGGAKRIGRAISLSLARSGYDVVIHHRNSPDEAENTAAKIHAIGSSAMCIQADLSASSSVHNLIAVSIKKFGSLQGIVNNASMFVHDDIDSINSDNWDSHMDVNAKAPMLLIQALKSSLPDRGNASVVNVLDQKVFEPNPDYLSYTASRYALLGLTDALARGLAPQIRVNAVAPGHTLASSDQSEEGFARASAETPLGFGPTPDDIADAVNYLLNARAVTGQVLFVDSGERFLARARDVLFETE